MAASPRQDIRSHVDALIEAASKLDPNGIDNAIHEMPGAWDIAGILGQRHGYGYYVILECAASGYKPVLGFGHTIADALREASHEVKMRVV